MTLRKRPASAALVARLERETIEWIKSIETAHWPAMVRVWHRWLPGLPHAAQERILVAMLREAVARREAWPADLVTGFAHRMLKHLPDKQSRDRVQVPAAFRAAAAYRARGMSWNDIAAALDVPQATVRHWARTPDFAHFEREARAEAKRDEAQRAKLQRFGEWLGVQIRKRTSR
jgi:hypothetical protein